MCVYMTYDTVEQTRTITCIGLLCHINLFVILLRCRRLLLLQHQSKNHYLFTHNIKIYPKRQQRKVVAFVQISINHVYKVLVYSDESTYTREPTE